MKIQEDSPFRWIERVGLLVITAVILFAIGEKCVVMWNVQIVTVTDILLLFMYLELITMVKLYWHEGRLSVLLPIFIAIIGIARHMMADSQEFGQHELIVSAAAIALLSVSLLILAYCQVRFSFYPSHEDRRLMSTKSSTDRDDTRA